jgi:hypothetical protein
MAKENIDRTSFIPTSIKVDQIPELSSQHPELTIIDQYDSMLEELFLLRNPKYKFDKNYQTPLADFIKENHGQGDRDGFWFYFPWSNTLIHYLPEDLHHELRTGRNRYLISTEEQLAYYKSTVAILGMSVGSHVATTIAMSAGSRHIKLADPDVLSGDNLNRIRVGFTQVGTKKVIVGARLIAEMNPYAQVDVFPDGISDQNADEILDGADVVVEEMDNPYWKFKAREEARKRRIPVVMGTDNGDGIIVDIERFDLDANYPLFHGLAGDLSADGLKEMKPTDLPKVAATIAGAQLAPVKMIYSVSEVGKSLYSWPQLGTAANLCGSVLSCLVRKIVLKAENIKSGRYEVNLDSIFESDWNSDEQKQWRATEIGKITKAMGL